MFPRTIRLPKTTDSILFFLSPGSTLRMSAMRQTDCQYVFGDGPKKPEHLPCQTNPSYPSTVPEMEHSFAFGVVYYGGAAPSATAAVWVCPTLPANVPRPCLFCLPPTFPWPVLDRKKAGSFTAPRRKQGRRRCGCRLLSTSESRCLPRVN